MGAAAAEAASVGVPSSTIGSDQPAADVRKLVNTTVTPPTASENER
jgi:hypothetical protein